MSRNIPIIESYLLDEDSNVYAIVEKFSFLNTYECIVLYELLMRTNLIDEIREKCNEKKLTFVLKNTILDKPGHSITHVFYGLWSAKIGVQLPGVNQSELKFEEKCFPYYKYKASGSVVLGYDSLEIIEQIGDEVKILKSKGPIDKSCIYG